MFDRDSQTSDAPSLKDACRKLKPHWFVKVVHSSLTEDIDFEKLELHAKDQVIRLTLMEANSCGT